MCIVAGAAGAAAASAAAMTTSAVIGAAGVIVSAVGASQQSKYQSEMMERNAKLAERSAADALSRGREEESRHRMMVLRLAGEQTAAMAASGLSLSDGTPESILEDTYYMGELDAAVIRENARREAEGYMAQAGGYQAQAGLYSQAGSYGVGTSLLSGATSLADQWYRYTRPTRPGYERSGAY